ncbi:MAG: GAF domain-containing protein, partial [Ignavibacteriales bacterium]
VACSRMNLGQGVCGTTAEKRETIIVPDVSKFPGHIYCDAASKSEIVIPIIKTDGSLFGVLDLDSYEINSFNDIDKKYLEEICKFLSEEIIN